MTKAERNKQAFEKFISDNIETIRGLYDSATAAGVGNIRLAFLGRYTEIEMYEPYCEYSVSKDGSFRYELATFSREKDSPDNCDCKIYPISFGVPFSEEDLGNLKNDATTILHGLLDEA